MRIDQAQASKTVHELMRTVPSPTPNGSTKTGPGYGIRCSLFEQRVANKLEEAHPDLLTQWEVFYTHRGGGYPAIIMSPRNAVDQLGDMVR
jgi:hypothetical protein